MWMMKTKDGVGIQEAGPIPDDVPPNYRCIVTGQGCPQYNPPNDYVVLSFTYTTISAAVILDRDLKTYYSLGLGFDAAPSAAVLMCEIDGSARMSDLSQVIKGASDLGYGSAWWFTVGGGTSGGRQVGCFGVNSAKFDSGYGISNTNGFGE